MYPEEYWPLSLFLSLPLFSTLSFSQVRPTPEQRPFDIRPHSIHQEFSPDSVAQVSLDNILRCYRLSSFLSSRGTLWPKGPLGRYLGTLLPPSAEKAIATHSSTLAWKIPWTEEPGGLQSMGSPRVGHDRATSLSLSCIGEGNGNPLHYSCLETPRDRGAWWAAVCGVSQSWT